MIFKKKEKEPKPKKEKRVPVMKVGTHKKTVIALWLVLIASVSFNQRKQFKSNHCKRARRKDAEPIIPRMS